MLKNDFFEFNSKIKLQVLGLAIGTKLASPNTHLFMDKFETSFLKRKNCNPYYGSDTQIIFSLYGRKVGKNVTFFLKYLNKFDHCTKLTYDSNKENIAFFDIKVSLRNCKVFTDVNVKPTGRQAVINIYISCLLIHVTLKIQLYLARICDLVSYAVQKSILKTTKRK